MLVGTELMCNLLMSLSFIEQIGLLDHDQMSPLFLNLTHGYFTHGNNPVTLENNAVLHWYNGANFWW